MADFSALKTSIQNYIKQNGNNEITGAILQQILLSMVTALGDNAINDLVTALGDEVSARQNADGTLQDNIDSEATARSEADGTLQQNIDNEATARQNADGTLQNNINNEATARGNADTQLGNRITSEAEAREGADNLLRNSINSIITDIEHGYVYAGIATPSTTPSTGKVFYLALTAGTYTNFGATVVTQGINILKYNGSAWVLDSFLGLDDAPTQGSNNLVKSGGVAENIGKITSVIYLHDKYPLSNAYIVGTKWDIGNTNAKGYLIPVDALLDSVDIVTTDYGSNYAFVKSVGEDNDNVEFSEVQNALIQIPANTSVHAVIPDDAAYLWISHNYYTSNNYPYSFTINGEISKLYSVLEKFNNKATSSISVVNIDLASFADEQRYIIPNSSVVVNNGNELGRFIPIIDGVKSIIITSKETNGCKYTLLKAKFTSSEDIQYATGYTTSISVANNTSVELKDDTLPADAKYLWISSKYFQINELPQSVVTKGLSSAFDALKQQVNEISVIGRNPLQNKAYFALGDSITAGLYITNESDKYAYKVAENLYMTYHNLGVSGAHLTNYSDTKVDFQIAGHGNPSNVMMNQVYQMLRKVTPTTEIVPEISADTDFYEGQSYPVYGTGEVNAADVALVTIAFGTNDASSEKPIGSYNDVKNINYDQLDKQSVWSAIKWASVVIRKHLPNAHIIVLAPMQRATGNDIVFTYSEAEEQAAERFSVPCINQFTELGIQYDIEKDAHVYLGDGLHPNEAGHALIAAFVSSKIRGWYSF